MKKLKVNSSMIYKCLAVVAFLFILTANIVINKGPNKKTDISLSQLSAKADGIEYGGEAATCLEIHTQQSSKKEIDSGNDCWADATDADINEGDVTSCEPSTSGTCNATTCKSQSGCYTKKSE